MCKIEHSEGLNTQGTGIIINESGFTEEYRDRHWQKCRYGIDPRSCVSAFIPKGRSLTDRNQAVCETDQADCDARWKE